MVRLRFWSSINKLWGVHTVPCRSRRRYSRFCRSSRDVALNRVCPVCKWPGPHARISGASIPPARRSRLPPAAPTAAHRPNWPTPAAAALQTSRPNPGCAGTPAANESGTTDGEPPVHRPFPDPPRWARRRPRTYTIQPQHPPLKLRLTPRLPLQPPAQRAFHRPTPHLAGA